MLASNLKAHRLTPPLAAGVYSWLALGFFCLLLLALTAPSGPVTQFLRLRPLRSLGVMAYGTYMVHLPVLFVCFGLLLGTAPRYVTFADAAVAFVALAVTVTLAYLSWVFLEKPLLRRGHRHQY